MTVAGTLAAYAQTPDGNVASTTAAAPASGASVKVIHAENRRLQKAVVRSLSHTKGVSAGNILVVARGGVVTLAGSVPDAAQVALAVNAARRVDGVKEVKETLAVRP
ncbi:MAG: BON domain-containing protein [Paraburkholderia sp.]|nr:MAG: BON domain-containing protein [Paraburkholderia sp.]